MFRLGDQLGDFTRPRVAAGFRFFEDRSTIHQDLESSAARRNQLEFGGRVEISELSRQTGSSRLVVSNRAVFDSDIHSC
jgi:hypothetical protein